MVRKQAVNIQINEFTDKGCIYTLEMSILLLKWYEQFHTKKENGQKNDILHTLTSHTS
jgi:hypothetical protein